MANINIQTLEDFLREHTASFAECAKPKLPTKSLSPGPFLSFLSLVQIPLVLQRPSAA